MSRMRKHAIAEPAEGTLLPDGTLAGERRGNDGW